MMNGQDIKKAAEKIYKIDLSFDMDNPQYGVTKEVVPYDEEDGVYRSTVTIGDLVNQESLLGVVWNNIQFIKSTFTATIYINRYSTTTYKKAYQAKKDYIAKVEAATRGEVEFPGPATYMDLVQEINKEVDELINKAAVSRLDYGFRRTITNMLYSTEVDSADKYDADTAGENREYWDREQIALADIREYFNQKTFGDVIKIYNVLNNISA